MTVGARIVNGSAGTVIDIPLTPGMVGGRYSDYYRADAKGVA